MRQRWEEGWRRWVCSHPSPVGGEQPTILTSIPVHQQGRSVPWSAAIVDSNNHQHQHSSITFMTSNESESGAEDQQARRGTESSRGATATFMNADSSTKINGLTVDRPRHDQQSSDQTKPNQGALTIQGQVKAAGGSTLLSWWSSCAARA